MCFCSSFQDITWKLEHFGHLTKWPFKNLTVSGNQIESKNWTVLSSNKFLPFEWWTCPEFESHYNHKSMTSTYLSGPVEATIGTPPLPHPLFSSCLRRFLWSFLHKMHPHPPPPELCAALFIHNHRRLCTIDVYAQPILLHEICRCRFRS